MCELFAMSSRLPATVDLSLERFAAHGEISGRNPDGWGIAYYERRDARILKQAEPAASSDWIRFITAHQLHSHLVIAHIRRATRGANIFENTQPYVRELGGRAHVFAHNGDLPGLCEEESPETGRFRPMGETDSELAFCTLLAELEPLWLQSPPTADQRLEVVEAFGQRLRDLGPANFLYSDGEYLFAHGHRRCQQAGHPPRPPGLHVLERVCQVEPSRTADGGLNIIPDPGEQRVTLLASVPLSDEDWRPLGDGELLMISQERLPSGGGG